MRRFTLLTFIATALLCCAAQAQEPLTFGRLDTAIPRSQAVTARSGMVAAQEARAARIGADILKAGGNAVDAAVATGFALAVTYPRAGNIGGGGFMMIHLARGKRNIAIDYRETAPAATPRNVFLDARGEADPAKSRDSGLAIGVPGTVAGLAFAHRKYGSGKFTLAQLIAPAVPLAREGFTVDGDLAESLPAARAQFARWPASARIFLKDGRTLAAGEPLVQADLAATLDAIARGGERAFYEGPIAQKIAASVRAAGGLMSEDDLKGYRAVERTPVVGRYRGHDIVSMPPPSSGGALLVEILNILEGFPLGKLGAGSPDTTHLMVEAMKRAYADRAVYFGDPDFVKVPMRGIVSKSYAKRLRADIRTDRATPSDNIRGGAHAFEGDNTTHFSVADQFGNVVSNTYTLNLSFGVGLVADGTGILLNNELDDFAAKPGAPNAFGLVHGEANLPAPRKRPLSSMTPTIVLKGGKPYLLTGSPGGSRIISTVLLIVSNVIDHGMTLDAAISTPRIHHQWLPDEVSVERGFPDAVIRALEARGHKVTLRPPGTSANSIMLTPDGMVGVADARSRGALAAGVD